MLSGVHHRQQRHFLHRPFALPLQHLCRRHLHHYRGRGCESLSPLFLVLAERPLHALLTLSLRDAARPSLTSDYPSSLLAEQIVYPNPGPSVQYFGAETSNSAATVLDNCPFNEDSNVTIGPSGSSSVSTTTSKAASSSASSSTTTTRVQATTTTSQAAATTTTRPSSAVTTQAPTTTSQAQATTTSKATSLRNPRTKTYMNSPRVRPTTTGTSTAPAATTPGYAGFSTSSDLAASLGVTSSAPTTTPAPTSSSAPSSTSTSATASTSASGEAYVQCNSTTTWSLCGNGVCTFMGAVPAGTVCKNGAMVMERRKMVKRQEKGSHLRMKMVRRARSAAH